MTTFIYDVVDAYRTDLANADVSAAFGERDALWLSVGTVLQQALALPESARAEYLRQAFLELRVDLASFTAASADVNAEALANLVETVSEEAEDSSAYALAMALLELGRALIPLTAVRLQGRLLTREARVHRKLGELETAEEIYDQVECRGAATVDEELVCRGRLGKAIVARMRGNYPASREHFRRVLDSSSSETRVLELKSLAHHGMMIAAAVAEDFETALHHGWTAYDLSTGSPARQAELLVNISNICNQTRHFRAALNGYLMALSQPLSTRVRLTAIGGAAVAAANLGNASIVDRLSAEGSALMRSSQDAYEIADLERALAQAYYRLGDTRSGAAFKQRALERARRGGFFEIAFEAETLGQAAAAQTTDAGGLPADTHTATSRLASQDSDNLLSAALSHSGC